MRLNSILTVLDKPKHRQTALKRALEVQQRTGAPMEVVSFCWQNLDYLGEFLDAKERRAVRNKLVAERKAWLEDTLADAAAADTEITSKVVWSDDIAGWVAGHASETGADLIIKSVHYARSIIHTPLDWQLLREATVPMLMASTRRHRASGNVLAAIDLRRNDRVHTRLNKVVLDAASTFAELTGAKLHCVYVVEVSQVLKDLDAIDTNAVRRRAVEKSRERLEGLVSPYKIPKSRIHLPVGKVGQSVASLAHKLNADVVVIGTAAHRARQLVGLGNSAERVLDRTPCDVLAVHP